MLRRTLATAFIAARAAHSASAPVSHSAVGLVSNMVWDDTFRTSNATGAIRVKGFNISAPFPGVESDDWVFTIRIRDSIPRSDGKFATGIWVQLDAPDNLVQNAPNGTFVPQDPSWQVCQSFWDFPVLQSSAETVPGSCEGVVPKECIDAITDGLARGFGRRSGTWCSPLTPPALCEGALGKFYSGVGGTLAAGNLQNVTENGVFDYARMGLDEDNDGHQLGNNTAYDLAIRRVTLVGLTWGYKNVSGRTVDNIKPVAASVSCLRVNQIEPGSRRLSAGVSTRIESVRLMGVAVAIVLAFVWIS
ncbi:hypothetical protein B0T18DRAFT_240476 [Schizothecium vesticola]|uniref:Uncharacterized protein n=1 Tax=Schizothecium vesticola TaxID=314040 RepID=A0AA40EGY7_9PEZI|nr:hypothetical protein B0T18DRAFT_240476 [Schizothecium vesticola]